MTITRCFCSIAFRDEPIEEIIPKLADIGYDGVEIWGEHIEKKSDEKLLVLRTLAKRHNIKIECLSPYFWLTNSPELLKESLDRAQRFVHYAQVLQCSKIRTFTDAGPTGIGSDIATDDHWRIAVESLQKICEYDESISFVVELHPKTLADSLSSTQELFKRVDRPNLKILFHTPGWDLLNDYQALKSEIRHMHIQNTGDDDNPGYLEHGDCDLPGFLKQISNDGYDHSLSVEYCFKDVSWDKAASAFQYLTQHLPQAATA